MVRSRSWRGRVVGALFNLFYTNTTLYWLASTLPFAGQWRVWQRLVLPRLQGRDVLELGCGPGWLLADLVAAGYRCRAIDASPQMVAGAKRTLRRRGLAGADVVVTQGRAQAIPFPEAAFDTIVSTFPAPYIADVTTMHEVARVLRPGGRLVIVMGASLIPRTTGLRFLVAIERVVYGRALVDGPPDSAQLNRLVPAAVAGLTIAAEIVNAPNWRAFLLVVEKPLADDKESGPHAREES